MKSEKTNNEEIKEVDVDTSAENISVNNEETCANVADTTEEKADNVAEKAEESDTSEEQEVTSELDSLKNELAEWKDKHLRLQAEFDNYRKRTLREKMDLIQTGGRDVLLAMLPVHDDVARAVAASEKSDELNALREGLRMIQQKFTDALRQQGVTAIEVVGKEFDAEVAEAVARFAAGEDKKGLVIDSVQTGYKLGDKVLRYAKVVVGE